jgi:hypothetical protein
VELLSILSDVLRSAMLFEFRKFVLIFDYRSAPYNTSAAGTLRS